MVKVTVCAIKSCPSARGYNNVNTPVSFFQPTTAEKLKTWSRALGFELTSKHRICQLHFKEDSIKSGDDIKVGYVDQLKILGRKVLKEGALPTIEHQSVYHPESQFTHNEHQSDPDRDDGNEELQLSDEQEVSKLKHIQTFEINVEEIRKRNLAAKNRPHACEVCEKRFILKHHLTTHMNTHSGDRPFICNKCGRAFTRKQCLNSHLQIHGVYVCSVCGEQFGLRELLLTHSQTHKSDLLYSCDTCGRKFRHRRHLLSHEIYHTAERPHACKVCGCSFVMETHLIQHMKTHGRPTLTCKYCNKEFLREDTLTAHILTHREHQRNGINSANGKIDEYTNTNKTKTRNAVSEKEIEIPLLNGFILPNYEQHQQMQKHIATQKEVKVNQYKRKERNVDEIIVDDTIPVKYLKFEPNKIHELEDGIYENIDMARPELNNINREPTEGNTKSNSEFYITVDEVPIEFDNEE